MKICGVQLVVERLVHSHSPNVHPLAVQRSDLSLQALFYIIVAYHRYSLLMHSVNVVRIKIIYCDCYVYV